MFCLNVFWVATVVGLLSGLKRSLCFDMALRVFFARNTTQVFMRVVCCNGSKINKLQISQFPGGGLFDCHRWRPLWLSVTMTSMFHQMASRSIIVHHLDIVGMPNRFCHSVNHRLLGENTRARSMFSMLCAVEYQVSKFCWSSATEDVFCPMIL